MKSGGEIFLRDGLNLKIKRKAAIQARHSHLFRRLAAILQKKDAHVSRKIAPADTVHRLRGEFYAASLAEQFSSERTKEGGEERVS